MPKENENIEIEVDESLNEFLSEDKSSETSNKVSFQLDTDGGLIGDELDEEVELVIEPEQQEPPKEEEAPVEKQEAVKETPPAPEKTENKEKETKRKSKAKERIKSLASQNRELQAVINKQQADMQALRSEYDTTTSTYAKVELERLTGDIARLESDLKKAADEGNGESIASITRQLIDSQSNIKMLQKVADQESSQPQQQQQQPSQQQGLSAAAEDWSYGKEFIIDNNEYKELTKEQRKKISPVRQYMATVARQLMQEGFSNSDPIFYEEMDIRLGEKFDYYDGLASDGLDALEYTNSDLENDASGETEKPQAPTNKSKNVPVKGSARSSSSNTASPNNPNKVIISKEMHNYWKNHLQKHMTLEEYALEVKKDQQRSKF